MKKIDLKINLFKNKTNTFTKKRFSPNKSWKIMKIFFALSFLLIIGFSILMFVAVDRGFLSKNNEITENLTTEINFSGIEKIKEIMEKKNSNFEYFKTPTTEVVDPYQN